MQIYFARSGGFMGMKLKTAVDTQKLPREEAQEWERVFSDDQFLNLPSVLDNSWGPDAFSYELTVVNESWQHTAVFTDAQVTEDMQPVIRRLTSMARSSPDQDIST